jgi:hypothetical protein
VVARDCKRKNGSWRGNNKGNKYRDKEKWKGNAKCKETAEEMNLADEEVAFVTVENPKEGKIELSVGNEGHNFDTYPACNHEVNDEHLIYYNWLADNATSSNIASEREHFESLVIDMGNPRVFLGLPRPGPAIYPDPLGGYG